MYFRQYESEISMKEIRICPVCLRKNHTQVLLTHRQKSLVCPNNHSFDISSNGYVNLLPPSAGQHGDNRAMVLARRSLLNTELYAPLKNALSEEVGNILPRGSILWDSGCGEGYYTSGLVNNEKKFTVYGSDLSTAALIESHKRSSEVILTAASSYALPIANHSCDAIICLFAPEALDEFLRVLKPGGFLFLGFPGRRHLFGLKEVLYETPYENTPHSTELKGFSLLKERELHYNTTIFDRAAIQALFEMTPYAYRTGAKGKEKLQTLECLETELHFHLLTYQTCNKN
jgi:23S rRNA (guanine745-N1)-methyltransferase